MTGTPDAPTGHHLLRAGAEPGSVLLNTGTSTANLAATTRTATGFAAYKTLS
ncbi:hypothetical protein [Streptomyces sp. NPDC093225]|uniref:hypothetical protein n=1 Tax=Streptomyces sp. NPDC093225 TaxID=3366034 RepID=UPI0038208812